MKIFKNTNINDIIRLMFPNYHSKKELKEIVKFMVDYKQPNITQCNAITETLSAELTVPKINKMPERCVRYLLGIEIAKELQDYIDIQSKEDKFGNINYSTYLEVVERWEK